MKRRVKEKEGISSRNKLKGEPALKKDPTGGNGKTVQDQQLDPGNLQKQ